MKPDILGFRNSLYFFRDKYGRVITVKDKMLRKKKVVCFLITGNPDKAPNPDYKYSGCPVKDRCKKPNPVCCLHREVQNSGLINGEILWGKFETVKTYRENTPFPKITRTCICPGIWQNWPESLPGGTVANGALPEMIVHKVKPNKQPYTIGEILQEKRTANV
ncbi:MAG: hypothetical protein ACLFVE_11315 [Chitinispirillaceae bacterium]